MTDSAARTPLRHRGPSVSQVRLQRVALVSLDQRWHDRKMNIERCEGLIREVAEHGCDIAIFPEMTLTGFSLDVGVVAESAGSSESLTAFTQLAERFGLHLVFGACLQNELSKLPQNMLCHADPVSGASAVYAKIHPFAFAGEHEVFQAGDALGFVRLDGMNLGASICYDLRFPYLFAAMAPQVVGAICIANWPVGRVSHWRALLIARAIENQMFMFGVNRIGVDGNGLEYERSSMAVAPDGTPLTPVHRSAEVAIYHVDLADTVRYRDSFPTLSDRRDPSRWADAAIP